MARSSTAASTLRLVNIMQELQPQAAAQVQWLQRRPLHLYRSSRPRAPAVNCEATRQRHLGMPLPQVLLR